MSLFSGALYNLSKVFTSLQVPLPSYNPAAMILVSAQRCWTSSQAVWSVKRWCLMLLPNVKARTS